MSDAKINVSRDVKDGVVRLQRTLGVPSQCEAVRRAVVLMDKVEGYTKIGYKLVLRSSGGVSDIEVLL